MKQKVDTAIEALKAQGHTVRPCSREGTFWFEINGRMLASWQEMEDLADPCVLPYGIRRLVCATAKRRTEQLVLLGIAV
jgi:hypothetical protein